MAFDDLRTALVLGGELRHVALAIANSHQRFGSFHDRRTFHLLFETGAFPLIQTVEQLLRRIRPMNFLNRLQKIDRKTVAIGLKKVMRPAGQTINHFRPSHLLRAPPGIEIAVSLESEAVLLDAHVAHLHFFDELVNGHAAAAFEGIQNFEPLSPADVCKQTLIHERGLTCCAFNDEEPGQANQNRRKSFACPSLSSSGKAICALGIEKMSLRQVERKLLPAACIPMIQTLLAATYN